MGIEDLAEKIQALRKQFDEWCKTHQGRWSHDVDDIDAELTIGATALDFNWPDVAENCYDLAVAAFTSLRERIA